MTLDEKIGQTVMYASEMDVTGPVLDANYLEYIKKGEVGAVLNASGVYYVRKIQKLAVENSRLQIPLLFGFDVIHGYKTIFPIPLAESCSWDLDLMEETAQIAATESSAAGLHWTFAPMVDISRDARWGRIAEGAGEDVYLGSLIAKARVRGFQGDLESTNNILACAKHFAGYGAAQAGRDYHTVDMSDIELRNTHLPPFKAALDEGVATFMTAFNELNGVPATGNKYLLDTILRKEWNFKGFVVTDYTSITEMIAHGYAENLKHAGEIAINAGSDMDMQSGAYKNHLKEYLNEEKLDEERLNEAVKSILRMKFKLGLFDDPYRFCDENKEKQLILCEEHLKSATEAAKKSVVLLKNKDRVLPLKKTSKIALIGPLANDTHHILGTWAAFGRENKNIISIKEELENKNIDFKYAKGCEVLEENREGFQNAITIAEKSDVVVMVMGETENMSGEAACRTNIKLPGLQQELIAEIKKTRKPIILVLMNGRPLDLSWEDKTVDAILETWFLGTNCATAITEVLYGAYNPSGKLTVTFPRNVGQVPLFYNQKNTGRPTNVPNADPRYTSKYLDVANSPLYPFGYGLSYTEFTYSKVTLDSNTLFSNSSIKASVTITNTGDYDGEEIVQLYIKDVIGSITRPIKELKGFKKITLKKGEAKTVQFEITAELLKFYNQEQAFVCEEGEFQLFIAGNSDHQFTNTFFFK
ncbi:glycoside hydrolase family 3 C-terminal domain-containing protein [Polaribacter haliotis]|uniref:Periplasmic beta-glucosidase n=2 Tax=Polaribacter haliotis TaxID=1888915 RepID=A0A7L8AKT3_9FLAO|nr:glycoside hydrolase family 3 C-terminal domain-containing protein [Polaribacter haliotis]